MPYPLNLYVLTMAFNKAFATLKFPYLHNALNRFYLSANENLENYCNFSERIV